MFLLLLLILVLIAFFFIIVLPRLADDGTTTTHATAYLNRTSSIRDMFIDDYKWCVANLTLKYHNLLSHYKEELNSDDDKWNYYFPNKLYEYESIFGFKELSNFQQKVTRGNRAYECNNVEPFIYEFHAKVEELRNRMNSEDIKLYKKYGINYNFLLTDLNTVDNINSKKTTNVFEY